MAELNQCYRARNQNTHLKKVDLRSNRLPALSEHARGLRHQCLEVLRRHGHVPSGRGMDCDQLLSQLRHVSGVTAGLGDARLGDTGSL